MKRSETGTLAEITQGWAQERGFSFCSKPAFQDWLKSCERSWLVPFLQQGASYEYIDKGGSAIVAGNSSLAIRISLNEPASRILHPDIVRPFRSQSSRIEGKQCRLEVMQRYNTIPGNKHLFHFADGVSEDAISLIKEYDIAHAKAECTLNLEKVGLKIKGKDRKINDDSKIESNWLITVSGTNDKPELRATILDGDAVEIADQKRYDAFIRNHYGPVTTICENVRFLGDLAIETLNWLLSSPKTPPAAR